MATELTLNIAVDGVPDQDLSSLTSNIRDAAEQFRNSPRLNEFLDGLGAVQLNRIRTRYLAEIDPTGAKWPQSAAAKRREAKGIGGGTLYATGHLWRSIQLYKTSPASRLIGTDVPYGRTHQEGLEGLPQRAFLGFSRDDIVIMEKAAELFVQDVLDSTVGG